MKYPIEGHADLLFEEEAAVVRDFIILTGTLSLANVEEVSTLIRNWFIGQVFIYNRAIIGVNAGAVHTDNCRLGYLLNKQLHSASILMDVIGGNLLTVTEKYQFRFMKFENALVAQFATSSPMNHYKYTFVLLPI